MDSTHRIRIAKIAGRYLVFDADEVSLLRRRANVNGTLVGTAPQQPTQNIFLGLPVEMRPEEADALVMQDLAYVVDDVAAHDSALRRGDVEARRAYVESLRRQKAAAHKAYAEMSHAKRVSRGDQQQHQQQHQQQQQQVVSSSSPSSLGVTPTCSTSHLVSPSAGVIADEGAEAAGPLCRFLQGGGYYMTPGLRFGARYSVYPGDPLRFHAHFMANQYAWDEDIPILDIVGGGRLATAVKKAFLLAGHEPGGPGVPGDASVRTFSVEWAGM